MKQLNILELAKQGDTNAINTLLMQWLNLPNITAKTNLKQDYLQVMLESARVPEQNLLVPVIQKELTNLGIQSVKKVKIYGRETGEDLPDWQHEFHVDLSAPQANIQTSLAITNTTANSELIVSQPSLFGSLFGAVAGTAGAVGNAAVQAGQVVAGAAVGIGGAALQATQIAGQAVAIVGNNPHLQAAIKSLNHDWLNPLIEKVDVVKAEAAVRKLQQEYPNENAAQISHRLMLEKAVVAGVSGVATSLAPGQAAAMFVVDWAATAALSVELVYQIAAAYELDLKDSERKGEAVAIFGLGLGGKTAIKAGLGLLRNLPVAGAVIAASSNAVMIYALGYAACQFYEAKQNPLTFEATLINAQERSEKYLEAAISQEQIMDQILVHIVLAGNPDKSWEDILPELQAANLSPASIDGIASHIKSPPSLETLLDQINTDFAIPLLAQCQKIANLDGVITPEETKVLKMINQKLLNLENMKVMQVAIN
ncbi:hypothetical protein NIES21_47580 [Anabaenopsis circularis NIES-21]|uniref:Uncharacterized protein n=1 Tax=Anabaenopsis circularis NIES-21 TaxID=1085406 RepID=A0A1Z4GN36_9CYAN|nr:hypothetical protein NIES21_47580 [Anabaenopsis circularis NIES-21]